VRAPVQPAPRRQEAAPAPVAAAKREERAAAAPAAAVEVKPAEIQVERRPRKLAYLLAAALLLILSAVGAFLYFNPVGRRSQEGAAADSAALALRAERNAGQLVLTWNREASQVKTAQRASLLIQDGDRKDDVELDLGILRSGSLGYTPVSNDVSFRLAVTDKQGKTISESFRVIAGRPSPAAPLGQPAPSKPESTSTDAKPRTERAAPPPVQAPQAASPPTDTQAAAPTPGGGAEPPPAATGEAKPPAPAPAKGESLAARLSAPTNLPEPPRIESQPGASAARPIETPVAAPPATQPAKPGPQQTAQPDGQQPATPVPGPAVSTPAPAEPLRVGGNVQQAKLLRQVTPAYPVLARQARISGVVQVEATVGRDGKVLKAAALNGPPLLRQAAVDAVRQWTYQPTTLNGQPVEVVTQVNVTFNLQR
jgi:protein TonB